MTDAAHPARRPAPRPRPKEKVPLVALRAMFGLCLVCLALVTWARLTDRPLEGVPVAHPVVKERVLRLVALRDGRTELGLPDGTVLAALGPAEAGFVAALARALQRERIRNGADPAAPVRLVRLSNGRIDLIDEVTGWRFEGNAYGADSRAALERLIDG